jgi:hypothetical protein
MENTEFLDAMNKIAKSLTYHNENWGVYIQPVNAHNNELTLCLNLSHRLDSELYYEVYFVLSSLIEEEHCGEELETIVIDGTKRAFESSIRKWFKKADLMADLNHDRKPQVCPTCGK